MLMEKKGNFHSQRKVSVELNPLSIGDPSGSEENEDETLLSAVVLVVMIGSSPGKQVSTNASRQLTNSSALSAVQFALVKGPANLHNPPNPQDWR